MESTETKIRKITPWSFRVPSDLLADFKKAADAANRSAAGELRDLMEKRVAQHKGDAEAATGKAA
jgi:hypothetical protein